MSNKEKYNSILAARYLLALAYSKGKVLNVTKVQKLLYMTYGYFLGKYNRIIFDESPKTWPYGPVFPKTRKKVDYSNIINLDSPDFNVMKEDSDLTEFFNLIIDKYAGYSASQLSEWSHSKGGPWDLMTQEHGFNWNKPIDNELIKNYFSNINF